jgi:hypothetical protein
MKISMRKSSLKAAGFNGDLKNMWFVSRWESGKRSRSSAHACKKDMKKFKPWQHQKWGKRPVAEFCPVKTVVEFDWSDYESRDFFEYLYRREIAYEEMISERGYMERILHPDEYYEFHDQWIDDLDVEDLDSSWWNESKPDLSYRDYFELVPYQQEENDAGEYLRIKGGSWVEV